MIEYSMHTISLCGATDNFCIGPIVHYTRSQRTKKTGRMKLRSGREGSRSLIFPAPEFKWCWCQNCCLLLCVLLLISGSQPLCTIRIYCCFSVICIRQWVIKVRATQIAHVHPRLGFVCLLKLPCQNKGGIESWEGSNVKSS